MGFVTSTRVEKGRTPMPDGATRFRLSILAFDDPAGLWQAIGNLFDSGLTAGQLCLLGRPEMLDQLKMPDGSPGQIASENKRLLSTSDTQVRLDGTASLAARYGSDIGVLLERSGPTADSFAWMQDELSQKLANQAEAGAIILLVSAATAEQHAASARVLLKHGRNSLQTHEFWWPDAV